MEDLDFNLIESARERFLELRRAILKKEYSYLNPMQREAVFAVQGPLLLLAGAGSGKTTVLINRVSNLIRFGNAYESDRVPWGITEGDLDALAAYLDEKARIESHRLSELLAVDPVKPWKILVITFTNKAADELKSRLTDMLGSADADAVWAFTFHKTCVRILRRDAERIGYKSSFTIYDEDDVKKVIKDLLKELNMDEKFLPPKAVANALSRAKDALLTPENFAKAAAGDYRLEQIAKVYKAYQRRLKEANAMDFDDLIMQTVTLFETCPDVLEYYRDKFSYILIDEYQDTNLAQYRFSSMLADGHKNICVVGDDDQSIYKFRGATIKNILGFESDFPGARVIRLEQNYRSTGNILNAANALIANNSERKGKTLWTARGEGEKLVIHIAEDEVAEAEFVAETILKSVAQGGKWHQNTVLYRMNALSNTIENALIRNGIPYRVVGGMRFFDRAEIKDMLSYLCVIANPADTLRLTRIINTPARGIGDRSLAEASGIEAKTGLPLFEILKDATNFSEIPSAPAKSMERFAGMIEHLAALSKKLPLDELYALLLDESGYRDALISKPSEENRGRLENIAELQTNIVHYMQSVDSPTLEGFLEETSLYSDIDQYDEEADAVTLMTIHAAKGLEFDNVFLVGMEEGLFPSYRSMEKPEDLEEERRLAYVGITRAKTRLYLTCARRHMVFGRTSYNPVSRFIGEIPRSCAALPEAVRSRRVSVIPGGAAEHVRVKHERYDIGQPAKKPSVLGNIGVKPLQRLPKYEPGMSVTHTVFGSGMILSCRDVAGDVLLEIAFEGKGTKRFLARSAQKYIKITGKREG